MAKNYKDTKKKYSNKGNKFPAQRNFDEKSKEEEMRNTKGYNSPEWLTHNPELTDAAGRLVFARRLGNTTKLRGVPLNWDNPGTHNSEEITQIGNLKYPSFMAIHYVPTFGYSEDFTSALNLSASQIAAYMRTQISGSRSYDPSDLMIHILALSSIFDAINLGIRAYGIARKYNAWDTTTPRLYLTAMGFEPDSIMLDMARVNGLINKLLLKMSTFAVPNTMKYVLRHQALTANIFCDSAVKEKAQKYFFVPVMFHEFHYQSDTFDGGQLQPVFWLDRYAGTNYSLEVKTIDQWYKMVDQMINRVLNNSDFWTIDGDIRKAFGDRLMSVNTIPMDYNLEYAYDPGMSSQFENMTILNTTRLGESFDPLNGSRISVESAVTQDLSIGANCLVHRPKINFVSPTPADTDPEDDPNNYREFSINAIMNSAITSEAFVNFHWDNPSPVDIAYALQMCTLYRPYTIISANREFRGTFEAVTAGTEIIVGAVIQASSDATDTLSIATNMHVGSAPFDSEDINTAIVSAFDWHPVVHYSTNFTLAGAPTLRTSNVDIDNWTIITRDELKVIKDANLLSIFDVPERY